MEDLTLYFEELQDTGNGRKVELLRSQLAIVDRAIDLIGKVEQTSEFRDGEPLHVGHSAFVEQSDGRSRGCDTGVRVEKVGDKSFKIDTMSVQLVTCPQCLEEMDVKKLKSHVSHSCPNKMIVCPELNCGCRLPMKHLRRHLLQECEVAMRRRRLVEDAEARKAQEAAGRAAAAAEARHRRAVVPSPETTAVSTAHTQAAEMSLQALTVADDFGDLESRHTMCPKCSEAMRQSQLTYHLAKLCPRRPVMCPNLHTGCQQRLVPLYLLQQHLLTECAAERQREAMIARSQHRHELMKCPGCGEVVALMDLKKHERELCVNRRVPCRNHPLGCPVMVRLKDRALHERVDGIKAVRPALYLPGHGAHLALGEGDLCCPWTAEYWIYRPPAKESLKMHLRNVFLLIPKYMVAFAAELRLKDVVLRLVERLRDSGAANDALAAAEAGKLTKEQRAQRARELAQARADQVNGLSALVPVYTDTVLAYTRAFQELAVSVEAGLLCAEEVLQNEVPLREPEAVTLAAIGPGEIAKPPKMDFSFLGKAIGAGSKRGPAKSATTAGSTTGSQAPSADDASSVGGSNSGQGAPSPSPEERGEAGRDEAEMEAAEAEGVLGEGYEDYPAADGEGDWDFEEELLNELRAPEAGNGDDGQDQAMDGSEGGSEPIATGDEQGGPDSSVAERSKPPEHGRNSHPVPDAKENKQQDRAARVDWDAVVPFLFSGSALSSVFQACLHAEYPCAFAEARRYGKQTASTGTTAAETMLLHPDLELEYLLPPPSATTTGPVSDSVQDDAAPEPERISSAMRELRLLGVAAFLADVMVAPQRSARKCALPWVTWRDALQLVARALKTDFDALQGWRVDTGLLKPDTGKAKVGHRKSTVESDAKHERAQEKKEKARLKRELKKQEKLLAQGENGTDPAAEGAGGASALHGAKRENDLFKRVGELLKAGCGTGILAEATSRTSRVGEASYTKVCLSLGSGLSLLAGPADSRPDTAESRGGGTGAEDPHGLWDEVREEHHYGLLLRPQEFSRLARNAGKFGIVAIPHTVGELTGMSDQQLQALEQQQQDGGDSDSTEPSRPNSPNNKANSAASVSSHQSDATKDSRVGASRRQRGRRDTKRGSAGAGVGGKKASSLARVGVEARSFEVEVPRGRWTHIALVAVAVPQNKLTLYMDGVLVKTLKDCAFPLPMAAFGGGTQSFETFEGALLDVRYWRQQRSAIDIIDNMHRLLELERDGVPGKGPAGLVAWWTFEDGAGKLAVTDVTSHRFKTPIAVRKPFSVHAMETTRQSHSADGRRPVTAGEGVGAYGYFCAEEQVRYPVPEGAVRLLPAAFRKLLPGAYAHNQERGGWGEGMGAALSSMVGPPWEIWMQSLPKWSWLQAESLPTPQLPAGVRNVLHTNIGDGTPEPPAGKERPPVPPTGRQPNRSGTAGHGVLPVPSLRARGICPYELRRHRLATKGRELQREVDCPQGCPDKVRVVDVRFHVRFACGRRIVPCRFDICSAEFPAEMREEHERMECTFARSRHDILSKAGQRRTLLPCPWCSEEIMQRDLSHHQNYQCSHRLTCCPYRDCEYGSTPVLPAHMLQDHLRFECSSPARKSRFVLVERARQRRKYPRPWGIPVYFGVTENDGSHDEGLEFENIKRLV